MTDFDEILNGDMTSEDAVESLLDSIGTTSDGGDVDDMLSSIGVREDREVPDLMKPWMKHHEFVRITTVEEVRTLVDEAINAGYCSLDLECEGLDNRIFYREDGSPHTVHAVVGYCMSINGKSGYYIPIRHKDPDRTGMNLPVDAVNAEITRLCLASQPVPEAGTRDLLSFKSFQTPPRVVIDFWHASFDQEFLYPITGIDWWHPDSFQDGNLASFCLRSEDKNLRLKEKSKQLLKDPDGNPYEMIELKQLFLKGRRLDFSELNPDEPGVIRYACSDGICTKLLCNLLIPQVSAQRFAFTYRLEKQVAQVKRVMERNRVKLNRAKITELRDEARKKWETVSESIKGAARERGFDNFEPSSTAQLSRFLFTPEGMDLTLMVSDPDFPEGKPAINQKSEQYKTDGDTLDNFARLMGEAAPPILKWVVEYRELEKSLGTYLENMLANLKANDEMRFQFKQTGAATGRFSAPAGDADQGFSGIPIHGIPATSKMRHCFEARDGYLMVKCDYAGQELRIVTNISGEPVWTKEFLEGEGDLHSITARAFFGKQVITKEERKMGKISNFALVYGGGPASIMRATGCDRMEATRRKQAFDKTLPIFAKWVAHQHQIVKKDLGITTAFGRWIAIPDANIRGGQATSSGKVVDDQQAKAIRAACERHATNYPIQSAGADTMKIAMVLVHKELHSRGWLRNGGDDSVRMLLTVHDEIVFEVKPFRVAEALDVITEKMEAPAKLPRPVWKVPLITDPLVGQTWGSETQAHPHKPGKELKPGEILVGKFVIDAPDWLREALNVPPAETPAPDISLGGTQLAEASFVPGETPSPLKQETPPAPVTASKATTAFVPVPEGTKIVTVLLNNLSSTAIHKVIGLCSEYWDYDGEGAVLRLKHDLSNETLIEPRLGIRIKVESFVAKLVEYNLSAGKYAVSVE